MSSQILHVGGVVKHTKKFLAVLSLLFLSPALGAKSKKRKPVDPSQDEALASSVVHRGSVLGRMSKENFRVVIPGLVYRANILQPQALSGYIKRKGIKSIINAVGEKPEAEWWQKETQVCAAHGVKLYNIPLHSHEYMHPDNLAEILDIFDTMQGPFMVHCVLGIDRTGTVVGLWLYEKGGATRRQALKQLSFVRYGHYGFKHPQMRSFLKLWTALRDKYDRAFALREYRAIYEDLGLEALRKLKTDNELLKEGVGHLQQITYNLDKGRYRPRSLTYKWQKKFQEQVRPAPKHPVQQAVQRAY